VDKIKANALYIITFFPKILLFMQ